MNALSQQQVAEGVSFAVVLALWATLTLCVAAFLTMVVALVGVLA